MFPGKCVYSKTQLPDVCDANLDRRLVINYGRHMTKFSLQCSFLLKLSLLIIADRLGTEVPISREDETTTAHILPATKN